MDYTQAKYMENKVVDYYENEFKKVDPNSIKIYVNEYDYADLVMQDSKGNNHCIEVKYRTYDYKTLLFTGTFVDKAKLDNIKQRYGVSKFTLITLTSDGRFFKSIIHDKLLVVNKKAPKKSCFGEKEYVYKDFYVTNSHIETGYTSDLDVNKRPFIFEEVMLRGLTEEQQIKFKAILEKNKTKLQGDR